MIDHAKRLRNILATTNPRQYVGDTKSRLAILDTADYIDSLIEGIRILYFYGHAEGLSELPEAVADIIGSTEITWIHPEPGDPQ